MTVVEWLYDVIAQAGVDGATSETLEAWHSEPYIDCLISKVTGNMESASVVQHFAVFDPRSSAFKSSLRTAKWLEVQCATEFEPSLPGLWRQNQASLTGPLISYPHTPTKRSGIIGICLHY